VVEQLQTMKLTHFNYTTQIGNINSSTYQTKTKTFSDLGQ